MDYMHNVIEYLKNIENMLETETNGKCELIIRYDKNYFEEGRNWNYEIVFNTVLVNNSDTKFVGLLKISDYINFEKLLDISTVCSIILMRIYTLNGSVDDPCTTVATNIKEEMRLNNIEIDDVVLNCMSFAHAKAKVFNILDITGDL